MVDVVVVGAGVFGLSSALALRARGFRVLVVDKSPYPNPLAASWDVSRIVRAEYGTRKDLAQLALHAMQRWRLWNAAVGSTDAPYHESGIAMLSSDPLPPQSFEEQSFATVSALGGQIPKGHILSRAGEEAFETLRARCGWQETEYRHGTLNSCAGWVEANRAIAQMRKAAAAMGVLVRDATEVAEILVRQDDRILGVRLAGGDIVYAATVVVAAGAWSARLVPALRDVLTPAAQPVVYLKPQDDAGAAALRNVPVYCIELAKRGIYGFPADRTGTVKLGHHGPGVRGFDPDRCRELSPETVEQMRSLADSIFPRGAPFRVVHARLCVYTDSCDGDFIISALPGAQGLVVATGGSGHGFKFAPIIGDLVVQAARDGNALPQRPARETTGAVTAGGEHGGERLARLFRAWSQSPPASVGEALVRMRWRQTRHGAVQTEASRSGSVLCKL